MAGTITSFLLHFYQTTTRSRSHTMSWPDELRCSSQLQSHLVALLSYPLEDGRRTVSSVFFDTEVPSVFNEEFVLPCHPRYMSSLVFAETDTTFCYSYLSRIGKIKNPSCSACGYSTQDISFILHCSATNSLRRSLFDDSFSICKLCSKPWRVARFLTLHRLPPWPPPLEGAG